MKVTLSFEKKTLKEVFPLSVQRLNALSSFINSKLKDSVEMKESRELLGFRARNVGLFVCADEKMRELHLQFKSSFRTTDVLSFASRDQPENVEPGYLGDIVLCLDAVERNARRYKRSLEEECETVFLHSYLHLLGFEHVKVSAKRAERMKDTQKKLLREWKKS